MNYVQNQKADSDRGGEVGKQEENIGDDITWKIEHLTWLKYAYTRAMKFIYRISALYVLYG